MKKREREKLQSIDSQTIYLLLKISVDTRSMFLPLKDMFFFSLNKVPQTIKDICI